MATRPCDLLIAAAALVPAAPVCLLAAAGVWLADGRPVLHKSRRVGCGGRVFTMYKFRTMRSVPPRPACGERAGVRGISDGAAAPITTLADPRVFPFGAWLRKWKVDELPQFVNVLAGDMAIVGPRPEDPAIVDAWYGPLARETLTVRPGLASPGSIYNFTHGEPELETRALPGEDAATTYARVLLPRKLALDLVYVREASFGADLRIMMRAAAAIVARGLGRRTFPDPPEMPRARGIEADMRIAFPRLAGFQ
jgi:lipopolysaccharide/colanic/teichoic acid biosynthesis glycosyltransferase